jgi:hypothetical protein
VCMNRKVAGSVLAKCVHEYNHSRRGIHTHTATIKSGVNK